MEGLEKVIQELRVNSVEGEIWIDGSFVTEKMNPEDVDLALRVAAQFYENATQKQREAVDWLASNLRNTHLCHSYSFMEWPEDHTNYWVGQYMYNYWMKQFGFSRSNEVKGIPFVVL